MLGTLIDTDSLRSMLDDPALRIVDCRFDLARPEAGRARYREGHVPGAVYAHLDDDLSAPIGASTGRHPLPPRERFAERLGELGIANDSSVVAYDDAGGAIAARLWWMLRWMGHEAVAVLDGGFQAWVASGHPTVGGDETRETTRFDAAAPLTREVSAADIVADRVPVLLDARAQTRFEGREEPIDPVAGHVPGATNHPMSRNLGPDGRFLDPAELARRYRKTLAGADPGSVAAMCGSGVTACHLLLAMEHAGLGGAALYPGSWSEWIRDPARPVVMRS